MAGTADDTAKQEVFVLLLGGFLVGAVFLFDSVHKEDNGNKHHRTDKRSYGLEFKGAYYLCGDILRHEGASPDYGGNKQKKVAFKVFYLHSVTYL